MAQTFDVDFSGLGALDGPNPLLVSLRDELQLQRQHLWEKAYAKAAEGYVVQIMDGDRLVSQLMHRDPAALNGEAVAFDMTGRIG